MGKFGEQPIRKGNKPPEIVDFGAKIFLKAHNLHMAGKDLLGSMALEFATRHSLETGMKNMAGAGMPDGEVLNALNRERVDLERADLLVRKIQSGEIGRKKKRPIVAKSD